MITVTIAVQRAKRFTSCATGTIFLVRFANSNEAIFKAQRKRKADPKFFPVGVVLIPFAEAFVRRGGDVEAVLHKNQIPTNALANPNMFVEATACYAAMEDMANLLGDPDLGATLAIEAAKRRTPAIHDAASKSVIFGDFLCRFIVEIDSKLNNVRHRLEVSSDAASFEIRRTITPRGATIQIDAVNIAFCVTVFKRGLRDVFDPARLTVLTQTTRGVPANFVPKRNLLRSTLNGVKIAFPPERLSAPFSLDWQIEEPQRGASGDKIEENILAHFRSVIEANIDQGDLALSRFAELVGLHPRRVQRILSANGMSFRQLKEDARRGIAMSLLTITGTPIADIAS